MARPAKDGADYFPLDTVLSEEFEYLEAKHGNSAFVVIVKLWQAIYRDKGYYLLWNERTSTTFSRKINVNINTVNAIINSACDVGMFSQWHYDRGVLTSHGIQKRFFEISKRRNSVQVFKEFLVNVDINEVPANINLVSVPYQLTEVHKEKKSKEKEITLPVSVRINSPVQKPDPVSVPDEETGLYGITDEDDGFVVSVEEDSDDAFPPDDIVPDSEFPAPERVPDQMPGFRKTPIDDIFRKDVELWNSKGLPKVRYQLLINMNQKMRDIVTAAYDSRSPDHVNGKIQEYSDNLPVDDTYRYRSFFAFLEKGLDREYAKRSDVQKPKQKAKVFLCPTCGVPLKGSACPKCYTNYGADGKAI